LRCEWFALLSWRRGLAKRASAAPAGDAGGLP